MNDDEIPCPELDPMVPLELDDPKVEQLLQLAARERRMDPSAYVSILVDCDRRRVKPLLSRSSSASSQLRLEVWQLGRFLAFAISRILQYFAILLVR